MDEWKIDKVGRRYRMNGNMAEYECTITTTRGPLPESYLQNMELDETPPPPPPLFLDGTECPFSSARGFETRCRRDCNFYREDALCALVKPSPTEADETGDPGLRLCPMRQHRPCVLARCGLWDGRRKQCGLIRLPNYKPIKKET